MGERLIETEKDVEEGAAWLAVQVPEFRKAVTLASPIPLRRKPGGFAPLFSAVIGQQVSIASAAAIWARLEAAGLTGQAAVAAASWDDLRACGLSRPKITYAHALSRAEVDYASLAAWPDEAVIAELLAIKGIGRWTAEIYAMFSLGRADVFAAGDLALQAAAQDLFSLPTRPDDKTLRAMAEAWSPWRAVAARILWAYYRVMKEREGIR